MEKLSHQYNFRKTTMTAKVSILATKPNLAPSNPSHLTKMTATAKRKVTAGAREQPRKRHVQEDVAKEDGVDHHTGTHLRLSTPMLQGVANPSKETKGTESDRSLVKGERISRLLQRSQSISDRSSQRRKRKKRKQRREREGLPEFPTLTSSQRTATTKPEQK